MYKKSTLPLVGRHPFHLVEPSIWPFLIGMTVMPLLAHLVDYLHGYNNSDIKILCMFENLTISELDFLLLFIFVGSIINWFYDIIIEATYQGYHTIAVIRGLRLGMMLFIISEIMFFFSFFWAFFHSSINPSIWIGGVWPPIGLQVIDPWKIPFLNTLILLSSGITVTWAHRAMIGNRLNDGERRQGRFFKNANKLFKMIGSSSNIIQEQTISSLFTKNITSTLTDRQAVILGLIMTIFYGCLFTSLQYYEYTQTTFTIADGIYGSTFFVTTGFHGLHVIIGTIFLAVCLIRHYNYHFMREYHFGFEAAIWYWHFVDVVWICLFVAIYWWGSGASWY